MQLNSSLFLSVLLTIQEKFTITLMKKNRLTLACLLLATTLTIIYACSSTKKPTAAAPAPEVKPPAKQGRVLVFTKTKGYYHQSIPTGAAAIMKLGAENGFAVDTTPNADYFVEDSLKNYSAVVFLSTTMNVLNADQQVAFERYIQAGGGFVGIHAAADTEYDWPWYNKLVGAYFLSHPAQQKAIVQVNDKSHISTAHLPDKWERFDEWYSYKSINPNIKVLATLDETTYTGGANGDNHPIIWYHEFDGGRSFYTGGGHTKESYSDPVFLQHMLGGLKYAMGENKPLDYSKAYSVKAPEDNRFTKTVLSNDLNEPMELIVAPDGRVFFTERAGKFYMYDPKSKTTKLLRDFPVKAVDKYLNGLIGVTLDPDFVSNSYIYFFYSSSTGEQLHQNISRFKINADNTLDTASEKIIIKIPIDAEVSAHTGGSLAWDKYKNLYISTGDNTVPFESHGYAPMDERDGRKVYDAQRSAGNPNDLRGKILRIHPEPDGTYTVPDGNLFAKGTAGTRPEIYVMGCRNPYRITVDTATSIVYWGEVGPDAGQDSRHGPRGYDEFNQAKKPGNFGWPYFVGNNQAYHDSDFAAQTIGSLFDVNAPVNPSPNNTGIKNLPPATPAMIYYPYNRSTEFPDLGEGGRCAMGGPFYHYNPSLKNENRLPAYYDKSLFVYDWMRNWVFAVRFDENNNFKRIEPFMHSNGDFRRPVDMEIGPDGVIYMLEYGSVYGIDNEDARLVRIDYNGGNRAPIAKITTKDTIGLAPYKASLSSRTSIDFDETDKLQYEWTINGEKVSSEPELAYSFAANGIYKAVLKVSDPAGATDTDTIEVKVGNTLPQVKIATTDNSTFFFNKPTALSYAVDVKDAEDNVIDKKAIKVAMNYIAKVMGGQALVGHQQINETFNLGKALMANSDCKACHQLNAKSVGPAFLQVSKKYAGDKTAISKLANKIITGGGGVWGEHAMNAHPQLSREDATEIVKYVMSLSVKKEEVKLPATGNVVLKEHMEDGEEMGRYFITATYTDKGGAITPLSNKDVLMLRPSKVQAEDADQVVGIQKNQQGLNVGGNNSYFLLRNIDLKDVQSLTYRYASAARGATISVRIDSAKGKEISTVNYEPTGARDKFAELSAPITDPGGKHNLYFVFVKVDTPNTRLGFLDWVRFEGGKEVKVAMDKKPAKVATTEGGKEATKQQPTPKTAGAGNALMTKSDCFTCHRQNERIVGPSFNEITKKYKNDAATKSRLADKVIKGGAGVWGQVPMTPHPQLSKKDATEMVNFILSKK